MLVRHDVKRQLSSLAAAQEGKAKTIKIRVDDIVIEPFDWGGRLENEVGKSFSFYRLAGANDVENPVLHMVVAGNQIGDFLGRQAKLLLEFLTAEGARGTKCRLAGPTLHELIHGDGANGIDLIGQEVLGIRKRLFRTGILLRVFGGSGGAAAATAFGVGLGLGTAAEEEITAHAQQDQRDRAQADAQD